MDTKPMLLKMSCIKTRILPTKERSQPMKRISDEKFLAIKPYPDTVYGIRVKDGEFYFLAWMEDAPNYRIQQATQPNGYLMDRENLIWDGNIYKAVTSTKEYNSMNLLYNLDDNGNIINDEDKEFANEYEKFLSLINPYERNGKSDPDDHDILMLTNDELSSFCDLLRDGDYILIIDE